MTDDDPLWAHTEHMAFGTRMLWNGVRLGFWLGFLAAMGFYLGIRWIFS